MTSKFLPGITDPLPGAEVWPPTIEHRRGPDSIAAHLAALRAVASSQPQPPRRSGRGIVTVGGGRYWPGIVVGIRLLREAGCNLPVEVWHRGRIEPVRPSDLAGLGDVFVIDAEQMARREDDRRVTWQSAERGGWESKLYALTHTTFSEVLFLDADAYCVTDPSPLFSALGSDSPFVFWSDMPHCEHTVCWSRVWPDGANGVPTVQGGQLLIDTRRAWRLLAVAHWMCQHSDYYFAHVYGDQDCWRVGLAAGACGFAHLGEAAWRSPAFVCSRGGTDYIVHRCQSKMFTDAPPVPSYRLPREARALSLFRALIA